jgi:spore coat protein U-like protein
MHIGDTAGDATNPAGIGNGSAQPITIFGEVANGQTLLAQGAYSDTIVVSLSF